MANRIKAFVVWQLGMKDDTVTNLAKAIARGRSAFSQTLSTDPFTLRLHDCERMLDFFGIRNEDERLMYYKEVIKQWKETQSAKGSDFSHSLPCATSQQESVGVHNSQ